MTATPAANARLPRTTPESVGVSSEQLTRFLDAFSTLRDPHGLVLVRHGQVVLEAGWAPYQLDQPHLLFSLSKSFLATSVGFAVDEGLFGLDDLIVDLFPDDLPPYLPEKARRHLAALRVRHLLTMTSGHAVDATPGIADLSWAKAFLATPLLHEPGTRFVYNSGASYLLSALVQQRSGHTVIDYLTPRLLEPLGIEATEWGSNREGINFGGWGLSLTTEDAAKFGLLYLQRGIWNAQQILPNGWAEESTRRHVANGPGEPDWEQGYGFQFWRSQHGYYRGDGAFGQYCIVLEEFDAVLAITSGLDNMQEPLDIIWKFLPAAFSDAPLPDNKPAQANLHDRCSRLQIAVPAGGIHTVLRQSTYQLSVNDAGYDTVTVEVFADRTQLTFSGGQGQATLIIGHSTWITGSTTFTSFGGLALDVATTGRWVSDNVLSGRMAYLGGPFTFDFTVGVTAKNFHIDGSPNVGFMSPLPVIAFHGELVTNP